MTYIVMASSKEAKPTAMRVFEQGGLVAIPTETVYGLAADATNGEAVARIYEAKGRPSFNPLIAHCSDLMMAQRFGCFSDAALECARHFWPGPLTIVVPSVAASDLSALVRAGLDSVALRVPLGISADIIGALGRPIAAPSANLSGRISPTTAAHVQNQLSERVDLIVDGGACNLGVESTIVSFVHDKATLLRPGGTSTEDLERFLGAKLERPDFGDPVQAPGMLASHYAPRGLIRSDVTFLDDEDGALNFGKSTLKTQHTLSLSPDGDLREAAAKLFACLADFDERGVHKIAVAPIPREGLGEAINDRLRRAAAPRLKHGSADEM